MASNKSSSSSCVAEQHNQEGSQAFKSADYDAAYRCYSRAIKAGPTAPKYWTNRANTLFWLGRTRQVIDYADAAIKADASWMKAYYFRALAHEKLGNLDQAIQSLRQAAQLEPGSEGVTTALNRCLKAKDAARRSNTAASSKSFCNDPARAEAVLQQARRGLVSSRPSHQQQQHMKTFGAAHSVVMQADKLRYGSPPDLLAAAALYKKAAEMGSASGQLNYAQMIQQRRVAEPVAAAMPWLLKAAAQEPVLACMPGCPNIGVVEAWVMAHAQLRPPGDTYLLPLIYFTCSTHRGVETPIRSQREARGGDFHSD
ncbi:hypothetical protein COO60DRAFT_703835 [Scenedesmus sp. NREL 46B-D3]|nr:hypothetical protein COO60DRAFT_703835 [Scenedesmus sp. NREL 46B-D3]